MGLKILNISDIHFKKDYFTAPLILNFFASFKRDIQSLEFDLVILNGDIAYSGSGDEYKDFHKILRSAIPEHIPIVSIVGNHDVSWIYISDAIRNQYDLTNIFELTPEDVISDITIGEKKFNNTFKDFRLNFENEENQIIKKNFEYKFDENLFCGYLFDKTNGIFVMLLNSAFFSFGKGVMEVLFNEKVDNKKDKSKNLSHDELKEFARQLITGELSQNGKQSYFLTYYPFYEDFERVEKENPDKQIKIVSFVHHPPTWIRYEEQFSKTNADEKRLDLLLELSSLITTGHLHTAVSPPNILSNTCYHLSNGAFLEYDKIDKYLKSTKKKVDPIVAFPNNWFILLDIDSDGFSYQSFKLRSKKIDPLNYELLWKQEEERYYPFLSKTSPLLNTTTNAASSSSKMSPIRSFLPRNMAELSDLIQKHRSNVFALMGENHSVKTNQALKYKFNNKEYWVFVNSIENFQSAVHPETNVPDLEKNLDSKAGTTIFTDVSKALETLPEDQFPILAFYEFFKTTNTSDKDVRKSYEETEHKLFLKYQSFKHFFYTKYDEKHRYRELSIAFDCFLV